MADEAKTVEFDPGIGALAADLYLDVYVIENDIANMPQFARKARYFAATYRKILKSLINNLGFYRGCLGWAYYIVNEHKGETFTGNPFVNYTEEQKAKEILNQYREFLAMNEGFINAKTADDIKLPEGVAFSKSPLEIKAELEKAIETKNLDDLINL